MSEPDNVTKINQILLKPVALLSDDTAELSDAYLAALTATLAQQNREHDYGDHDHDATSAVLSEHEDTAATESDTGVNISLEYVRPMSGGVHVLRLEPSVDLLQAKQLTETLSARDDVEYAEPDQPRRR